MFSSLRSSQNASGYPRDSNLRILSLLWSGGKRDCASFVGMAVRAPGTREVSVTRVFGAGNAHAEADWLAVEEPLEIVLAFTQDGVRESRTLTITMRTPGNDRELAAGFLFAEGIVQQPAEMEAILTGRNTVRVELSPAVAVDWPRIHRQFLTASSCGLCGRTVLDDKAAAVEHAFPISAEVLASLPERLRSAQSNFRQTGGLHASALFHGNGELDTVMEDVGRHNALDKVIGREFLAAALPLAGRILLVSGRASYELVQKAARAGIPVLAAIGAPSSLAVDLAAECGMTLAGFVREGRFNLYAGSSRIHAA